MVLASVYDQKCPLCQLNLINAGQHSSPESGFANKTKMFFRAKNKRRQITGL